MDTSHPKHRLLAPLYRAQQGDRDVLASWRELGFRMITNGVDTTDESLERLEDQVQPPHAFYLPHPLRQPLRPPRGGGH